MTFDEGKVGTSVNEVVLARVLKQDGRFAEEKKVDIVVVIVIQPDRLRIRAAREGRRVRLEFTFRIHKQCCPRTCEDTKINDPIVVKVTWSDIDHFLAGFQP